MCNTISPKKILYYALVVPQPNKGQAPIAVADLISSSHSMLTISRFLNTFIMGKLSCLEAPHVSPSISSRTEVQQYLDPFSLPESTIEFYKRMYHLVTTSLKNFDEYCTKVISHACLSHNIKDAKTEIKRRWVKLHVSCFNYNLSAVPTQLIRR